MGEKDREEGRRKRLEEAFPKGLYGHGFQYAALRHFGDLNTSRDTGWKVDGVEVPVEFRGESLHLDFVLASEGPHAPEVHTKLVVECKKGGRSLDDWCFIRTPISRRPKDLLVEYHWKGIVVPTPLLSPEGTIYNHGFPVKMKAGGDEAESMSEGRQQLSNAVSQVLRGVGGLAHLLAQRTARGSVLVPVVFTTARLWGTDALLEESDLRTGRPPDTPLTKLDWLWLRQPFSETLRYGELRFGGTGDTQKALFDGNLARYVDAAHARCVAIVSVDGIEPFLRAGWDPMPNTSGALSNPPFP